MPTVFQSKTDAQLAALVAIWTAAFAPGNAVLQAQGQAPILVKDGQWLSAESAGGYVVAGWTGFVPGYQYPSRSMSDQLFAETVTSQARQEGLAPSMVEISRHNCACITRLGEGDSTTDARNAAYANYKICGQAIAQNLFLNGTSLRTTFGISHDLKAPLDRRGSLAVIAFAVECWAYSMQ